MNKRQPKHDGEPLGDRTSYAANARVTKADAPSIRTDSVDI